MYTESVVEEATLAWFQDLGFDVQHGPDIDPVFPKDNGSVNTKAISFSHRWRPHV